MSQNQHTLPFHRSEYDRRLAAVRRGMEARGIDVLTVFGPENVCYLTGYETIGYASYQALFIPAAGAPVLLIREMEREVVSVTTWLSEFATFGDTEDPLVVTEDVLRRHDWIGRRIAVERTSWFLSAATYLRLMDRIGNTLDGSGIVEQARRIKAPAEIALIREACHITEQGMKAAMEAARPGVLENDVAAAAYQAMMGAGSDFLVGDPIVTSGWRSGVAHTTFAGRRIQPGDTVLVELGACRRRYFGPLMRTAVIGSPSPEVREFAQVVIAALEAAIAAIRPGVTSGAVDEACRGVIERAGCEAYFRKRTGYSVGVAYAPDWGEGHIVSLRRDDPTPLQPGMVFHMPPALRHPRRHVVGMSETVLVTEGGCEVLTRFPRELHIVRT